MLPCESLTTMVVRAAAPRPADRGVDVVGHHLARAAVLGAGRGELIGRGDAADAFHVGGDEDLLCRLRGRQGGQRRVAARTTMTHLVSIAAPGLQPRSARAEPLQGCSPSRRRDRTRLLPARNNPSRRGRAPAARRRDPGRRRIPGAGVPVAASVSAAMRMSLPYSWARNPGV